MIEYVKGDLFLSDAPAIAHGCNTLGRMGAGIAVEFKKRYPQMYKEYQQQCGTGEFEAGKGYIYCDENGRYIFNLATQGSLAGAYLPYLESSFIWMRHEMKELGLNWVAMPKIGAGLGGLDWETEIEPLLIYIFSECEYRIEIRHL